MALKLNKSDVRDYLIDLAKRRGTCGYKKLAEDIAGKGSYTNGNYDGTYVAHMAGTISIDEANAGRPLLSVLIVNQGSKLPGKGFFELAQDLGLFFGDPKNKSLQYEYTKYELARVWSYWSTSFDESDKQEIALRNRDFDASKTPEEKERVVKQFERGPVGNKVKALNGYKCQVCEAFGRDPFSFLKPDDIPYIEAHHVVPVSSLEKGVLSASNVITVCANHHRQMHYGKIEVDWNQTTELAFTFKIDGTVIKIKKPYLDKYNELEK
jgi:hypothetical protein